MDTYRVRLARGLLHPYASSYQLGTAESIGGIRLKLLLLYIISIIISGISGLLGIGTESLSMDLAILGEGLYADGKLLAFLGSLVYGLFWPTVFIFLSSLFFWVITELPYKKIIVIQMFIFVLFLAEKAILLPIFIGFGLSFDSSPFALGVISQYLIPNEYFIHFFSSISLFQAAALVLNYYYLKGLSGKSKYLLMGAVCIFYLACWFAEAFRAYVNISLFV